uniref:Reverse transcriptase domain-containing protein n=1 Tax=Tanacetum cinerariifolium TaxID=118510 RepID=A0A6L2J9M8_TANCI|nr:hypothetical protein [Tanacetum cinerariifolium]
MIIKKVDMPLFSSPEPSDRDHGSGCCSSCWAVEVLAPSLLRLLRCHYGCWTAGAPSLAIRASSTASGAHAAASGCLSGPEATQAQVSSSSMHNCSLTNLAISITGNSRTITVVVEDIDPYLDKGIGDVIVEEPFCKDSCVEARRFDGIITIRDRDDSVTYQMARSNSSFKHLTNKKCNKILPLPKEDIAYVCLHSPKDHEGNKINTPYPEKTNMAYSSYRSRLIDDSYKENEVLGELMGREKSATNLKKLLMEKLRMGYQIEVSAHPHELVILDGSLPPKEKDTRSFTIPCYINNICFEKSLADLGASISVMPYSTFTNLGLDELAPTMLTTELADKTIKRPKGIAKNVLVGIDKFVFLVDFVVLDMLEDIKVPLILERPFLTTTHAKIDVLKKKITLRVWDDKIVFKSDKPTSNIIKRVFALGLRERIELDLEARLMGEALILNRSLDPMYGDYIELNDLNEPLKLKIHQEKDFGLTIEEGEVSDEPIEDIVKTRNIDNEINNGID